jgi:hypothetical protein
MKQGRFTAVEIRLLLLTADGTLERQVSIVPHLICTPEPLIHRRSFGLA